MPGRSCPFCGSRDFSALHAGMRDRLGLYGRAFDVMTCGGCGTAAIDEIPSAEVLRGLYPDEYIVKDAGGHGGLTGLWKRAEMRLFYDRVYRKDVRDLVRATGMTQGRLLDVGCGNGGRMLEFKKAGIEAEGIETSIADVEYVNARAGLKARLGTLSGLEFEPGAYSAVTFYNVLEHLPDPRETVKKVYGMLRPGGFIAVSGPVMDSLQAEVFRERWIEVAEMPRHIFIPSTKGMKGLLEGCGFSGVRSLPVSAFKLAHTMAESMMPGAIGADAYRRGRARALLARASGAAVMLLALPLAFAERLSRRECMRLFVAVKPGGGA